jgi:uncharacterized protein (TIGR02246 family)
LKALAVLALFFPFAAPAGEVTVIRPTAFVGADITYYVLVDGQALRDIETRQHVRFEVPAGPHGLSVRCPKALSLTYAETRIEEQFDAAPAFFVIEPKFDCVTLRRIDARAAAPLVASSSLRPADAPRTYQQGTVEASAPIATQEVDRLPATAAWVDAYNSRDPARIASLYDPDAVLIGTSAQKPAVGRAAIAAYFGDAASRPSARVALGEHRARVYGDIAVDSGLYNFFEAAGASATLTPARYTLVYRKRDGKWLIVEHHSSRVP